MKKRIIAMLLVVCLSAALLSTTVFAEGIFTPSSAFDLIVKGNLNQLYGCTHTGCHYAVCTHAYCSHPVCATPGCYQHSCVNHTCAKPVCTKTNCTHTVCATVGCQIPVCVDHTHTKPGCGYKVSFYTDGGTYYAPVTVYENGDFSLYTYVPVKVGYTFGGWYYDKGCTKPVYTLKPTCDVTLYAKWLAASDPVLGAVLPFVDVPVNSYFYPAVSWANGCGVAASASYFNPSDACSRAQMLTFLWRAAGAPQSKLTYMPFTDVSESAYYCEAVQWALEKGITKGTNNLKFRPNETVTRAEVVTMLYRYAGVTTSAANPYTDVTADDWFYDAVRWADSTGITNGTNNLQFRPDDVCTRSQVLTFLYRYFN